MYDRQREPGSPAAVGLTIGRTDVWYLRHHCEASESAWTGAMLHRPRQVGCVLVGRGTRTAGAVNVLPDL